jgi:hypothetical protein
MILHHLGYVVDDIQSYEKNLIYKRKLKQVIDPVQNNVLALYENYSNVMIELIQPINEMSPNYNFLIKYGNGFNHLCYSVNTIENIKEIALKYKLTPIRGPLVAYLFEHRKIFFYFSRNREIIEFILEN